MSAPVAVTDIGTAPDPLLDLSVPAMRKQLAVRLMAHATKALTARDAVTAREIAAELRAEIEALHGLAERMEGVGE